MRHTLLVAAVIVALAPFAVFSASERLAGPLRYIGAAQRPDGGWSESAGEASAPGPTSRAVKVLAMNHVDKAGVDRGVAFILGSQQPDGSWNESASGTGFALLALGEAGQGRAAMEKAADYLRAIQDRRGGFWRAGNESAPSVVSTAVVLDGLCAAGYTKTDAMVQQAFVWLASCQNEDGGYGPSAGSPSTVEGTAWSIIALAAYHAVPGTPEIKRAVDWLIGVQRPSGGFPAAASGPEDPETTACAIMALARIPGQTGPARKSAEYLGRAEGRDGSFPKGAAGTVISATCFAAWALSTVE